MNQQSGWRKFCIFMFVLCIMFFLLACAATITGGTSAHFLKLSPEETGLFFIAVFAALTACFGGLLNLIQ